jgi:hypothetical protein
MMNSTKALEKLAEDWGFEDEMEMAEEFITDSVSPGICMDCGYSTEVEPDQARGWCEECNKNTVVSCMVLMGVI